VSGVSAEAVGAHMPTHLSLDDVAAMAAADENHRYELGPEGGPSVAPPADPDHALLVTRPFAWFLTNGHGPEEVVVDCGIDIGGGRVPHLTVWARGKPPRPRPSPADHGAGNQTTAPSARASAAAAPAATAATAAGSAFGRRGRSAATGQRDGGQQLHGVVVPVRAGRGSGRLAHRPAHLERGAAHAASELVPGHGTRVRPRRYSTTCRTGRR
jgi:hypothetical protein